MQTQAQGIDGYGRDLNDALGNLAPFAEDTATLVDILNRQEGAVQRLVSNSGVVFGALSERERPAALADPQLQHSCSRPPRRATASCRRPSSRCRRSRTSRA